MKHIFLGAFLVFALNAAPGLASAELKPAAAPANDSARLAPRLVPLEGVQNFRDVGGYRTLDGRHVKWGKIYRSAELSHMTASDREEVARLGIHEIHDLRSVDERRAEPTTWTGPGAPRIIAFDYSLDTSSFAAFLQAGLTEARAREAFAASYPALLQTQRPQAEALFEGLLKADGATLYHCTAGKDRTGLATALILSALGVSRETILYDYELSNRYFDGRIASLGVQPSQAGAAAAQLPPEVMAVFMTVDVRYLMAALNQIDSQYGSVEAYLDQVLGVDAADIARLRALYTE